MKAQNWAEIYKREWKKIVIENGREIQEFKNLYKSTEKNPTQNDAGSVEHDSQ